MSYIYRKKFLIVDNLWKEMFYICGQVVDLCE